MVLAVDVGTSGVRAAIVDDGGRIRHMSRRARRFAGERRFDAEALWEDVTGAVRDLPESARRRVRAIGVAAFIGTVFVDARGAPVAEGRGWADDSGVDAYVTALGDRLEGALREIGRPVASGGSAPAALALRTEDPDAFAAVRRILTPKDFLLHALTGETVTDHTSAAYSLCSDVRALRWSSAILDALELPGALLPTPAHAGEAIGAASGEVAATWGVPAGTPVIAGGPDGTMGAFAVAGAAPVGADAIVDIAGTTDVLVQTRSSPAHLPDAVLNPGIRAGVWTVGGSTGATGGAVALWLQRFAGDDAAASARLLARALSAPDDPAALLAGPSLSGSRFPRWRRDEREWIHPPTSAREPERVVRAVLEGAAFTVREGLEVIDPEGAATVVLAGGSARSAVAAQLRADILGRPVVTTDEPDATLLAAAQLAVEHAGGWTRSPAAADLHRPDPERVRRYDPVYAHWLRVAERHLADC